MRTWSEARTIKDIELEEGAETRSLQAEVWIDIAREMYGADADGRRGEMRDTVTDMVIESIFDLETGEDVTEKYKKDGRVVSQIERGL